MQTALSELAEAVTDLFFLDGRQAAAGEARDLHLPRIRFELNTGQWVCTLDPSGLLQGVMTWYRCDDDVLGVLREEDLSGLARRAFPPDRLTRGDHVYVATAAVAPWAPAGTHLHLWNAVRACNRGARAIHGVLRLSDGRSRWVTRSLERCH